MSTGRALPDAEAAHGYLHRICFKTGPPGVVGAELGWMVARVADRRARVPIAVLRSLLADAGPLPGRSVVTFEPGGQVELSSLPAPHVAGCGAALAADVAHLESALGAAVLMSPLVWDLAHVGNYEELWLLRETLGVEAMRPEIDSLYDAFEHPRAERPTLPLLSPKESVAYVGTVRRKVLDSLETVRLEPSTPLLDAGFVYGMVLQHEHQHQHQHDETMLATHQLRRGRVVLPAGESDPVPRAALPPQEVFVARATVGVHS